jgi:peroxiredoxin
MHAIARCGLFVGLAFALLASSGQASTVVAEVGQPAPEFFLPSVHVDADAISLSDYRGRVVYLDFWSAWCAPCRRVMPALDALRRDQSDDDFEVVAVNVDARVDDARQFLDRVPVSYPVATDSDGMVAGRYGVDALPASFLIDRSGVVRRAVRAGQAEDVRALRAMLVKLIEGDDIQQ